MKRVCLVGGEGAADSNTATVSITINPVNDAPVANDDNATTETDIAVTISVLANDSDVDGDALSVTNLTQPANGTVAVNLDQTVTYTPNAGFSGQDSFTYTAYDGALASNVATVTVNVEKTDHARWRPGRQQHQPGWDLDCDADNRDRQCNPRRGQQRDGDD